MTLRLSKDHQLCISLAARPSNLGTRFHNYLYNELDLPFVYKAFTTTDLEGAVRGIRALGIRGCSVSMPFKEAIIEYIDEMDESARAIESVNTVVNTEGVLRAYNTDYVAIATLLDQHDLSRDQVVTVQGAGGMAKACVAALRDAGFTRGLVVARNEAAGRALAERYGYAWRPSLAPGEATLLVNATPLGMDDGPDAETLAFATETIDAADVVFDVVAFPEDTPLVRAARERGKLVITGASVIALQALEQFALYTGVRPSPALMSAASSFSRAARV
ncbi:shikimate 5-dehydrogenase [Micrococcales bacterium 31B]|nr:shikimate 5-dehydrogenase [Micrococcales bacterium 31B]